MSRITVPQALIALILLAAFAYAASTIADSWADWVVFAVVVVTFFGFATAVFKRQYPTRKRTFTRDSETSKW